MSEVKSMDWRDSRLANVLYYALVAFLLFWPRPHFITPGQNVAIDAVLTAVIVWMLWPVFKRATTPKA
jgi:hypothetical protein